MPKLSMDEIARTIGAEASVGGGPAADKVAAGYCFDTRHLEPGDLFFALKGAERDGHAFIKNACAKGAVAAVVARHVDHLSEDFLQIVVPSPLQALQRIAASVRSKLDTPVVAVSGSNGKTTTKDMLALLLGSKMSVHKSPGNFNNHIGVPLSILGLDEADDVLVIELGSNHRGEIRQLCDVAGPTIGVITNVGTAHIGHFGSVEEIAREKTDVIRCLGPGGKGIVNSDDKMLMSALAGVSVELVTFGMTERADFRAADVRRSNGTGTSFRVNGVSVRLRTPGIHNVYNAIAAMATASLFGISLQDASEIIASFESVRMKITASVNLTVIDDSYNANPDSIRAALDVVSGIDASRRVFIMGEMLELGDQAEQLHQDVGSWVASSGVDVFIGIGGMTQTAVRGARASGMAPPAALFFGSRGEAKREIPALLKRHDVVLVKGSRMAGLEEICDLLQQDAVQGRI